MTRRRPLYNQGFHNLNNSKLAAELFSIVTTWI